MRPEGKSFATSQSYVFPIDIMSNPKRTAEDKTERLYELLEDELLSASSEELDQIAREWGLEGEGAAADVDMAFEGALKELSTSKLDQARRAREEELAKLSQVSASTSSRDDLLVAIAACLKDLEPKQVTLQHRDLSELSESALRTMLQQLEALKG
jgi:hypothetical protein